MQKNLVFVYTVLFAMYLVVCSLEVCNTDSSKTYTILFNSIQFNSILFHSILFHSILFYSILFYSILFYSILFYSILFYSIPFYSILFYSVLFYSTLFYSILYYSGSSVVGLSTPALIDPTFGPTDKRAISIHFVQKLELRIQVTQYTVAYRTTFTKRWHSPGLFKPTRHPSKSVVLRKLPTHTEASKYVLQDLFYINIIMYTCFLCSIVWAITSHLQIRL